MNAFNERVAVHVGLGGGGNGEQLDAACYDLYLRCGIFRQFFQL